MKFRISTQNYDQMGWTCIKKCERSMQNRNVQRRNLQIDYYSVPNFRFWSVFCLFCLFFGQFCSFFFGLQGNILVLPVIRLARHCPVVRFRSYLYLDHQDVQELKNEVEVFVWNGIRLQSGAIRM